MLKKKNFLICSVLLVTVITFIICFNALNKLPKQSLVDTKMKVVIDAGHGGIDGGVVGVNTGIKESTLNLLVAKELKRCFLSAGIDVVMTRENENGLYGTATSSRKKKDMQKRKNIIENAQPEMVISVHMNKYSVSTRRGAQVFFDKNNQRGVSLANAVQKSLNAMEETVREYSALNGDYYILTSHNYPSIIVECGFLSNPEDEALLMTDAYRQKIAYAIFKGCIDYLSETTFYPFH